MDFFFHIYPRLLNNELEIIKVEIEGGITLNSPILYLT